MDKKFIIYLILKLTVIFVFLLNAKIEHFAVFQSTQSATVAGQLQVNTNIVTPVIQNLGSNNLTLQSTGNVTISGTTGTVIGTNAANGNLTVKGKLNSGTISDIEARILELERRITGIDYVAATGTSIANNVTIGTTESKKNLTVSNIATIANYAEFPSNADTYRIGARGGLFIIDSKSKTGTYTPDPTTSANRFVINSDGDITVIRNANITGAATMEDDIYCKGGIELWKDAQFKKWRFGIGTGDELWIGTHSTDDNSVGYNYLNNFRLTQSGEGGIVPRGTIIAYYSVTIPEGWALCDGNNGTPDLRGRFIRAASNELLPTNVGWAYGKIHLASPINNSGIPEEVIGNSRIDTSSCIFKLVFGDRGGSDHTVLDINQIPPHDHDGKTDLSGDHTHTHNANGESPGWGLAYRDGKLTADRYGDATYNELNWIQAPGALTINTAGSHRHSIPSNGSGYGHNNMPPYHVLVYIMRL